MFLQKQKLMSFSRNECKYFVSAFTRSHSTSPQPDVKTASARPERKMDKDVKPSESFCMNMFLGKFVTHQVFPYPYTLTADEKETLTILLQPSMRFFSEVNDAMKNDMEERIDPKVLESMKELGAYGMQVPTEYGGVGLNNVQYARFTEVIGEHDLGLGITLGAHQSIGYKGILIAGNEEQKQRYLPDLATGKKMAAFALTEPSSGSDASSIKSRAVPSDDGSHYILNGSKIWISNGGLADVFTVFAQCPVTNASGGTRDKVTAFVVERAFGGVTSGAPEKKMGIKASNTAEVFFENVKIPAENVLGGVGSGFKVAMQILNNGRFGMSTCLAGTMRHSMKKAVEFATNRTQFGYKISTFGVIQEKIARMAMNHYVAESLGYIVASLMDSGYKEYQLEAAISKVFSSEAAWNTADEALQVMGGMGYMREAGIERVMRDVRIFRIFEGTNDILRLFVALTGLQYAGGHLKELLNAFKKPTTNFGLIFDESTKRARRAMGIQGSTSIEGIRPELAPAGDSLEKNVALFGSTCEQLLGKFGKNIIHEQFLLHRLADSAIDIYTSSVVLSRASRAFNQNYSSAEHELKLARVWSNEAAQRIQSNLAATKSEASKKDFDDLASIAKDVCEEGDAVRTRPLGV